MTALMTEAAPSSGLNQGDALTVKGHGLSTTATENVVTVGGQPCEVFSAVQDSSHSPAGCPVTSCTQQLQTLITLQCYLPHLDTVAPHPILLGKQASDGTFLGFSPTLAGATLAVAPKIVSFSPGSGSVAGGTVVRFDGDGFSTRKGDIDIMLGGARCRVTQTNLSSVFCIAPMASDLTTSTAADVELRVRGQAAACSVSPCQYTYSRARGRPPMGLISSSRFCHLPTL